MIIGKVLLYDMSKQINVYDFNDLRNKIELHTALWDFEFGEYKTPKNKNNELLAYREKLINNSSFLSTNKFNELNDNKLMFSVLHQSLFRWLYGHRYYSLSDIVKSSNGKGIVICAGNPHFKYVRSTIDSLRNILNSTLPIEIFYNGEDDLSEENRKILNEFDNVYLSDISTYFDNKIIDISGFAIKPFSILASRFEEVLLMDADVVYLHDPEELFEEEGYLNTGTLFFKDRTLFPGPNEQLNWLKLWMVDPLPETKSLRFYNEKTKHEMESSTVLIHKTKTLIGLLSVCKLNEGKIRKDVVYKMVYGDKETFWLGFDMARQHYNMYSVPCAYVGKVNENKICGHIGHVVDNKLYFWNGHLVKEKKNVDSLEYIDFDIYFMENDHIEWSDDLSCLTFYEKYGKPVNFSKEELQVYNQIIEREKEKKFIIP
eukprot:jgi/Orpsp1_1/1191571/evm.model.d7180000087073.1